MSSNGMFLILKQLCLVFCLTASMDAMGQAKSLTIDNPSPGWLSSKIGYGDQQTVESLKITGYLNIDDLKFISTLASEHSLHGRLDLEDATIVGATPDRDNYFINDRDVFGNGGGSYLINSEDTIRLQYFSYPKSLVGGDERAMNRLCVDTFCINTLTGYAGALLAKVNHLKIGDNVTCLQYLGFTDIAPYPNGHGIIESIEFPPTLREIREKMASRTQYGIKCKIKNGKNLKVFPSLKRLVAEFSIEEMPDSVFFPNIKVLSLDQYHDYKSDRMFKSGMHVFIGEKIDTLTEMSDAYGIHLHFASPKPPVIENSIIYHGQPYNNSKYILHVPKGSVDAYRACFKDGGTNVTIIEEYVAVTNIELELHVLELKTGESTNLSAGILPDNASDKSIEWTSSDNTIVEVDKNGKVTAKKAGKATITATAVSNSEAKDECEVTVLQPVTGITLNEKNVNMSELGETKQLVATVLPEDASNKAVTWTSSNPAVCSVTNNGTLVAMGFGTATIMATTIDGNFPAVCIVEVKETTGINNYSEDVTQIIKRSYYTLDGRRVANGQWKMKNGQLPKGVYIHNGKKLVIK